METTHKIMLSNNNHIKVSVILPVYNGADYLDKAIRSILHQTYSNIELVIVDDGSTDNSGDIIKKYSDLDIRIRSVRQKNMGISGARNRGIDEAIGEYVLFIDQDDWYEEIAVEEMVNSIESGDYDEVITGHRLITDDGKIKEEWHLDPDILWTKYRTVAPWAHLYKKKLIDDNRVRFLDTKISEDLYFNILYMNYTNRIYTHTGCLYNWRYNPKSECRTNWNHISDDRNPVYVLDELRKKIQGSAYLEYHNIVYFFAKYIVWYLLFNRKGNAPEDIKRMRKLCFGWLDKYYPEYREWKYTGILTPKGELLKIRMCVSVYIFGHKIGIL